jgi:hypothetical protein
MWVFDVWFFMPREIVPQRVEAGRMWPIDCGAHLMNGMETFPLTECVSMRSSRRGDAVFFESIGGFVSANQAMFDVAGVARS